MENLPAATWFTIIQELDFDLRFSKQEVLNICSQAVHEEDRLEDMSRFWSNMNIHLKICRYI